MKMLKAFSLIELMVVIAIVAVLAAVAVPSYKSYTVRAKIANTIGAAAQIQSYVVDYYNKNGVLPPDTAFVSMPGVPYLFWNNTVQKIEIWFDPNTIQTGTHGEFHKILQLTPVISDANATVTWSCATHNTTVEYRIKCDSLPPACRTFCI